MVSYLVIGVGVGGYDAEFQRVVVVDLIGVASLIGGEALSAAAAKR